VLSPNTVLQNRYRIVRQLGQGGMGTVYEAVDQRLSSVVAIKEMRAATDEARNAFEREASLLANLRHPALPNDIDHFSEDDEQYLVMEFIPGEDLGQLLELRGRPFAADDVLRWADDLLKALEYLHGHNPPILHRDIKPSNLKLTREGELFLLDFGLAKGAAGQMPTLLTSRSVKGYTPVYSPLEQIHGGGTDPRSDLYSVGATLYHLLTGVLPVDAPTRFNALDDLQADPLLPADQVNPEVPSLIAQILSQALAMNRRNRPASASAMRRMLLEGDTRLNKRDSGGERKAKVELSSTVPALIDQKASLLPTIPSEQEPEFTPQPTIPAPAPEFPGRQATPGVSYTQSAPEAPKWKPPVAIVLMVALLLVVVIASIVFGPGILRSLRGSSLNSEPTNSNGARSASTATPGVNAPTPSPTPAAVKVRIRIVDELVRQDIKTASPDANATVSIRVDGKMISRKTDRQGSVTFDDVPCGGEIQITFPRFDYNNPDAKMTWTIKRNIACGNPIVTLGTYFTASGATEGKY
jgi:serine/threonine protein kinase